MKSSPVSFSVLWKLNGHKYSPNATGAEAYQVKLTYYPFADEKIGETRQNINRVNNKIFSYSDTRKNRLSSSANMLFLNKVKLGKPLPITSFEYIGDESSYLHPEIYTSHGSHQYRVLEGKEEKITKAAFF